MRPRPPCGRSRPRGRRSIRKRRSRKPRSAKAADADRRRRRGIVGLVVLLLIPVPRQRAAEPPAESDPSSISPAPRSAPRGGRTGCGPAPAPPRLPDHAREAVVFKAATDVVTDFGRVRDLDELTRVLGRAADVMDASGVDGLDRQRRRRRSPAGARARLQRSRCSARIPPVPRSADNAAAAAYRWARSQIVPVAPRRRQRRGRRADPVARTAASARCRPRSAAAAKHRRASRRSRPSLPPSSPASSRRAAATPSVQERRRGRES